MVPVDNELSVDKHRLTSLLHGAFRMTMIDTSNMLHVAFTSRTAVTSL